MGALLGTGTPSVYPSQQIPWGFNPQLSGFSGATVPLGVHVPQQLQQLQAAVHQLLQTGLVQHQQIQQIQQLLQIVPQQLQQIQQLIQFVAQQAPQTAHNYPLQSFLQNFGYPVPSLGVPSPWLGSSAGTQPPLFGGQGGFAGQSGYVM